jgi:Ohr subfamily peroxiredoxin
MSVHVLYRTKVTGTGGRDGRVLSDDGALDVALTTPRELGGAGAPGSNPEQLLGGAYAACFLSAMQFIATQGGPAVPNNTTVTATVGIGPQVQGGFGLDIQLDISLPGLARPDAEALVQRAHLSCPFSKALKNLPVRLVIA